MNWKQNQHLESVIAQITRWDIFKRFFAYLTAAIILQAGFFIYLEKKDYDQSISILLAEEQKKIEFSQALLSRDLDVIAGDLLVLANSDALNNYLQKNDAQSLAELKKRMATFSSDRGFYDQVRFIDDKGWEKVRINYSNSHADIVDDEKLQNKANRYYFKDSINLPHRELYVSPLDLNVEQNRVERPLKPMLRIATTVEDPTGTTRGIVILNYLAGSILEYLNAWVPSDESSQHFILNAQGYWINSPNKDLEWGFMFGSSKTFANDHPQVWKIMREKLNGQTTHETGIYTFKTVLPVDELNRSGINTIIHTSAQKQGETKAWILVSLIKDQYLQFNPFNMNNTRGLLILSVFIVLTALIIWLITSSKVIKKKLDDSLQLLMAGLEQSPTAIVITDKQGTIEYVNPKFTELTGYSHAEAIGSNPRLLKSGEFSSDQYTQLWKTITQGQRWQGEFHNKRKDGRYYWASANLSPIINNAGDITHFVGIQEDISEQKKLREQLELMSNTDLLTGINNRRSFELSAAKEISRASRLGSSISLMMIDIDFFKRVNDRYGHKVGDMVLKEIAKCLSQNLRLNDILARYGGEEFVVALPDTSLGRSTLFAERIREKIENLTIVIHDKTISITVSIGCSASNSGQHDLNYLLEQADIALYRAKSKGRNCVIASKMIEELS